MAGCGTQKPLPPLPEVSTASFLPAIRQSIDTALSDAKSKPTDAAANGRLGMVLQAHDQLGAAKVCYQRARALDPKNFDWAYYEGSVATGNDAIEPLRAALAIRDYLPARLKLGEALLAIGDSATAAKVLRGLDHPMALFSYGRATNDPAYYEKTLAAFPQYGAAMFALAQHYQRTGRAADASRLMSEYPRYKTIIPPVDDPLMQAVYMLNQGPTSLLRQAMSLEQDGRLFDAAILNEKALDLDPNLTQAHVNLISAYGRLGDPLKAEEHYRAALKTNPNAAEAFYNFGVLRYTQKRLAEAKTAFEKAIAINPGYAEAHINLGNLLQQEGKLAEAARHFERAIDAEPGNRLARFHLGRIYANQRRYPDAIAQFERIVWVDDEATPTYLYALGATYARAKRVRDAADALSKARERASAKGQDQLIKSIDRDLARLRE